MSTRRAIRARATSPDQERKTLETGALLRVRDRTLSQSDAESKSHRIALRRIGSADESDVDAGARMKHAWSRDRRRCARVHAGCPAAVVRADTDSRGALHVGR